jgi:hypothetical protein
MSTTQPPHSWTIQRQGLRTRRFSIDVEPYNDAFMISFTADVESDIIHVYFDLSGRMTHVKRTAKDKPDALAALEPVIFELPD